MGAYDQYEGVRNCAVPSRAGVLRGEVRNSYNLSMTSRGSLHVHHLYFPSSHLDLVSEQSSKTPSYAPLQLLATTSTHGHRANPPTPPLPVLGVTSLWVFLPWVSQLFTPSLHRLSLHYHLHTALHHHIHSGCIPDSLHGHRTETTLLF